MSDSLALADLIASRICHDLVSPIGAIGNGVELLALASGGLGQEITLIEQAVGHAAARLKLFRVAFGQAGGAQRLSASEIRATLEGFGEARMVAQWEVEGDLSRAEAKAALLALLVLERAAPWGGTAEVRREAERLRLVLRAPRLKSDGPEWEALSGPQSVAPGQVEFALLPLATRALGRELEVTRGETEISLLV